MTIEAELRAAGCVGVERVGAVVFARDGAETPELMAEGRIVAAGALADQGDVAGALQLMARAEEVPKKVRPYHLRQWYVLADLYDRSGDIIRARKLFSVILANDRAFADVTERLRGLGL